MQTVERIQNVARKVISAKEEYEEVIVVVSAMAGETERLIRLAKELSPIPTPREYDVLFASGEHVSIALLAIALNEMNCPAESLSGVQAKILTNKDYSFARIQDIHWDGVGRTLDQGKVAVVACCQGVDDEGNITTLGRGGSDTTAVALAAAFAADRCDIYTDVTGVFTADPRICPEARKLESVSYDEMLERASLGSKVMNLRSVEIARHYGVEIQVRSSLE